MFLSFDIVEFYSSISEELLDRLSDWPKSLRAILDDDITVIELAPKSLLFTCRIPWVRRNTKSTFDVIFWKIFFHCRYFYFSLLRTARNR